MEEISTPNGKEAFRFGNSLSPNRPEKGQIRRTTLNTEIAVGLLIKDTSTNELILAVMADSQSWSGLTQVAAHGGVKPMDWKAARSAKKNVRWFVLKRETKEELGPRFADFLTRSRINDLRVVSFVKKQDKL